MSQFSKIQFISWEIPSMPFMPMPRKEKHYGFYPGIVRGKDLRADYLGQCEDIEARADFTEVAMFNALAAADPDPATLKVFLAPEFLYRGAAGAYHETLLEGWEDHAPEAFGLPKPFKSAWPGLFGRLKGLARREEFAQWVFVFGTAVSVDFADASGTNSDTPVGLISNTALVQCGGPDGDEYLARKYYKSNIDFLYFNADQLYRQYLDQDVKAVDEYRKLLVESENSPVFSFAEICDSTDQPIEFGLEICLDHASNPISGKKEGYLRASDKKVRVQLVPSCGMGLRAGSLSLDAPVGGHAFAVNCDGLVNLDGTHGCHTQVCNESGQLLLTGSGNGTQSSGQAALVKVKQTKIITPVGATSAIELWNLIDDASTGQLRVSPAYDF